MSQITLYLDDEIEQLLRQSAKLSGVSNSKWVADLIKKHARQQWPVTLTQLAGSFTDFPLRDETLQEGKDPDRIIF
ncbi:hypothetical protein ACF3NA_01010 [Alkanindiges sp. WGS2144]|uniref:hypothetical protein n=1 Tax=Alkanindiges sp. WGS2144 TaxID=3366808 RepID=UPI003751FBB0